MIKRVSKIFSAKVLKNKRYLIILLVFVLVGLFLSATQVSAYNVASVILSPVTVLLHGLIFGLGKIATFVIFLLINIAKVTNFIDLPPVIRGWSLVRNLCNMFFILILLAIAFATILRVETYNAKKFLPRLIIMAILINFSKTICGLIIDFSQVIMLAFVYSFDGVSQGNFANMLGLTWVLDFDNSSSEGLAKNMKGEVASMFTILAAYILGLIYVIISIVVITAIAGVLVVRMVMLWIYVVISPLAYLAAAFPQGQGWSGKWWKEFMNYVTTGPMLAFFIWLSFVSYQGVIDSKDMASLLEIKEKGGNVVDLTSAEAQAAVPGGLTAAGSADHVLQFAISIGMLVGGLMMAQNAGGGMGAGAKIGAGFAKGGLDKLNRLQMKRTGLDLNPTRQMANFKESRKRAIGGELQDVRNVAKRRSDEGGVKGALLGLGDPDYVAKNLSGKALINSGKAMFTRHGKDAKDPEIKGAFGKMGAFANRHLTTSGSKAALERKRDTILGKDKEERDTVNQAADAQKNLVYTEAEYNNEKDEIKLQKLEEENTLKNTLADDKKNRADLDRRLIIANDTVKYGTNDLDKSRAKKEAEMLKTQIAKIDVKLDPIKIKEGQDDIDKRYKAKEDLVEKRKADSTGAGSWYKVGEEDKAKKAREKIEVGRQSKIADLEVKEKAREAKGGNDSVEGLNKQMGDYYMDTSSSDVAHRAMIDQLVKKIPEAMGADQRASIFKNAVEQGDKDKAEAYFKKMAEKGETDKLIKDAGFKLDADDFSDYVDDVFIKKLGMDEQVALAMQADLSDAGRVNNKEYMQRTVTVDANSGRYKKITGKGVADTDGSKKKRSDGLVTSYKKGARDVMRKAGSSFYGQNKKDKEGKEEFVFSDLGIKFILNNQQNFKEELKKGNFNGEAASAISSSDSAVRMLETTLNKIGVDNGDINDIIVNLKKRAGAKDEDLEKAIDEAVNEVYKDNDTKTV